MFCKWCGGNLTSADTKCKRCGREVAARSDCGGFYELVPDEKPAQPVVVAAAPKAKASGALIAVMAAGFAVLLTLVIVLFTMHSKLTQELEYLRSEIEDLTAEGVAEETTNAEETEGTEEITITLPELFSQEDEEPINETVPEV